MTGSIQTQCGTSTGPRVSRSVLSSSLPHISYAVVNPFTGLEEELIFEMGDAYTRMLFVHGGARSRTIQERCRLRLARALQLRLSRRAS